VTSQEDIDAAIGEANKAKSQDFSKIQGRFHTRLSLASSNTDEVIGERLLAKTDAAHTALRDVLRAKGDIINNQLAFVGNSVTLRGYKDAAEFVVSIPTRLTSSPCCKRSSSRSARSAPLASTSPAASAPCSTPSSPPPSATPDHDVGP
jgi:hypothetical protein